MKAADQSKKAGSTRKDAHPGDNRGMMSQDKHKGKAIRIHSATICVHNHTGAEKQSPQS